MTPSCPICHAEHCPETRPDCRARGEARRALYASANGFEPLPSKPLIWVERIARRARSRGMS